MSFGKYLKEYREKNSFSQAELAEMVGTSQQMIAYFENDLRNPNATTLILICQALDCTPNDLLGFNE